MRYKYETRGIVLARAHAGEATARLAILTDELGLVHARAQGVRRPGAKLAAALSTFAESSLTLVRGKEEWRLAGAVLETNWFALMDPAARPVAGRASGLLLRLAAREAHDLGLFPLIAGFFDALSRLPEAAHEDAEALALLRMLFALGFDAGEIPGGMSAFTPVALAEVGEARALYVARINRGIAASGL